MGKNPRCPNSSKLPFFRKNTPKGYFAAETGDFNSRPIPKYDLQCQSFTNTGSSPDIKILFKCNFSIGSQTKITAVEDKSFTNMLQD